MFRALLCPSSGACQTAVAASGYFEGSDDKFNQDDDNGAASAAGDG
jgi:hypothetical protein